MSNTKVSNNNKQENELQELVRLYKEFLASSKIHEDIKESYYEYLYFLYEIRKFSKRQLAINVSEMSGIKVTDAWIGKIINRIQRKRGESK